MKRCLVTGATGALGPVVVQAFRDAGYEVRAFVRRAGAAESLGGVEVFEGDIADHAAIAAAMQNVDVVVHLAAVLHVVNPRPDLEAECDRVNVDGTRVVTEAAANNPARADRNAGKSVKRSERKQNRLRVIPNQINQGAE